MKTPKYVVAVQCHLVKQRCSGYLCEYAFSQRSGGFAEYEEKDGTRFLSMTCGGCCGQAAHRKLSDVMRMIQKKEGIGKDEIVVHLSSCVVNDNYHGPPCPHLDYLETLIADKLGLTLRKATHISPASEKRRKEGKYETS